MGAYIREGASPCMSVHAPPLSYNTETAIDYNNSYVVSHLPCELADASVMLVHAVVFTFPQNVHGQVYYLLTVSQSAHTTHRGQ